MIALINLATLQQGASAPRLLPNLIMIASFIAIFYFLLLRPQRKLQQKHQDMVAAIKAGDEVMTDGGIIGKVVHIAEDRLTIRTAESTRIVVARGKIARVFGAEGEQSSTPTATS